MRALYKEAFEAATRDALDALSPRDRTLLRLHVVERMPLMRIGVVYDVSHTTIARRLDAARAALVKTVKQLLTRRLALSPSELASVAALVLSDIDVCISELLRSRAAEGSAA
jgi:RNA polymerase sigma-70 factor (ECF subfamily)